MCVCVQIYTCKCRCQQRPEEGIRSPGVTGSCKQPHGVLGIGPLSAKGVHILYPWVISPTSTFCFLIRGNHREDVVKCTEDSRDFTMQTHWFHTQINRKLSEKSSFWLLTPPHIQIITRNYWHSIPREVIYLDSSQKPKFRENTKNLSYSLFIQMTLHDMDRDFRVKAWIRKSNGTKGERTLTLTTSRVSASWDPTDMITRGVGKAPHVKTVPALVYVCIYEWSEGQVCTSALSLRRLCRVPDCVSQQICIPCSKMPMGARHWTWAAKGYSTKSHGYFQSKCKLQGKSLKWAYCRVNTPSINVISVSVCLSVCPTLTFSNVNNSYLTKEVSF